MKKSLSLIAMMAAVLVVSSCASNKTTTEKVEQEVKAVPASMTKSIEHTVKEQIQASALSQDKKDKLLALEEKAAAERKEITEEIEKTKVVMVETVLAPKMNEKEFNTLRNKIKALDKKRLDNGFRTLREVRNIIDPKSAEHQEIYKAVIENRLRGF
ncbi:hypothetical protein DOM21_06310 [Bacteriovorax stolpii]|uniref:hypothetical protein n=1 Tax=Bacteriovorax stolpii TaxID=960 RepID=UPI001157D8AC|nr:hypothetical protein [Bacteriovorax stolpii]QDK41072.1 hypothetical protein DOM21_06310 [Bacteriovorax stolpii]